MENVIGIPSAGTYIHTYRKNKVHEERIKNKFN